MSKVNEKVMFMVKSSKKQVDGRQEVAIPWKEKQKIIELENNY